MKIMDHYIKDQEMKQQAMNRTFGVAQEQVRCDICSRGDVKELGMGGYAIKEKYVINPFKHIEALTLENQWTCLCNRCWNEYSNRRPEHAFIRDNYIAAGWLLQIGFAIHSSQVTLSL